MSRLFVAVWLPPDVVDMLRALPRPTRPGLRWTARGNLHATLRFLGDAEADAVVARLAATRLPTVTVTLGATELLGDRVLVAPVAGLEPLAAAVADATGDLGEPVPARPFRGHVTLARLRRRGIDVPVGRGTPATWTVGTVAVVASELAPEGPTYTTVATLPTG